MNYRLQKKTKVGICGSNSEQTDPYDEGNILCYCTPRGVVRVLRYMHCKIGWKFSTTNNLNLNRAAVAVSEQPMRMVVVVCHVMIWGSDWVCDLMCDGNAWLDDVTEDVTQCVTESVTLWGEWACDVIRWCNMWQCHVTGICDEIVRSVWLCVLWEQQIECLG